MHRRARFSKTKRRDLTQIKTPLGEEISRGAQLRAIAHGLIQDNVGRRVINVQNFYSALVQALMAARAQAQADCLGEDVLTLT
jgi:hypothetical protein